MNRQWRVNMVASVNPFSLAAVLVTADYHVVEGGVLKFRNMRPAKGAYPVTVMIFAHGQWVSVENVSERP